MVILTGVSGFIGSSMLTALNNNGFNRDVVVVDDFYKLYKDRNTEGKLVREWMHRDIFLDWFEKTSQHVDAVIHLGARTDTTLLDVSVFDELNLNYSKRIWTVCAKKDIPLLYASSAATYGDGSFGFDDDVNLLASLQPLNPYGQSKHNFDLWAMQQEDKPRFWAGFKFFNVYGPNEYHKNRMASVVFHTYNQIKCTGKMNLFASHRHDVKDGHQSRDFIYCKDVCNVLLHFLFNQSITSGIYNLGTGKARTFLDLANLTFNAMKVEPNISFIETPLDIRETYQYFTQANMTKLLNAGYQKSFTSLEDGIEEYVTQYLQLGKYY